MEVITIESETFKKLEESINTIAQFVTTLQNKQKPTDGWVDSHELCSFLKISTKTLQRLRSANAISYSRIRGKSFYRISEIQRLLNENVIRRSDEHIESLIENNQLQTKQHHASRLINK